MKKDILQYSAHLKPIILPALQCKNTNNAAQNQLQSPASDNVLQKSSVLLQSHQNFIAQQTHLQQYFLHCQLNLWQKMTQIVSGDATNNFTRLEMRQDDWQITSQQEQVPVLPGPKFSRTDLELLASGTISNCFGDWFKPLDQYRRLIRMPEPPLLLADRVTGIDAAPGSMQTGTIWTETDVTADAWYLHHGRMPAGIMIEAGQADLLLISWLGFDFHNCGERVYRLLGCELSYHGELPKPGDTLCYDIHIDGHAKHGSIHLFFFHYDCRVNGELRLKVRNGQAGFFTDEELANSGGVLWDAASEKIDTELPLELPTIRAQQTSFDKTQLIAFSQGDVYACFGANFVMAAAHTRTPHVSAGNMLLLDAITDFAPQGGVWRRGYLRAVQNISPDAWFFKGHFKNDPCMPGTLMFEAGLQAAAFYLTALGFTLDKDGWRFEPVFEQTYQMRCRGQVTPTAKQVVYEIYVNSIIAAPSPTLTADLVASVDGLKAFHTKVSIRLVPDWPLTAVDLANFAAAPQNTVATYNAFKFDYASLLACALGKPSHAFGEIYKVFDNHRRVARLPAPPYHFMTRILQINGEMGVLKSGSEVVVEYDIPPDAWYFQAGIQPNMPFCVLLEAALQPCGWLASYMGSTLVGQEDLVFRNLDGNGRIKGLVLPHAGTLRTQVKCTSISQTAGMIIESFHVECFIANNLIYKTDTVFGFFPQAAFENQVGLPVPEYEKNLLHADSDFYLDLSNADTRFYNMVPGLPDRMLLMIDRITGFWPAGGLHELGQIRAEKSVDPTEWFFKAHFFQDPVQPGSLGIEAMLQTLQVYMLQEGMHKEIKRPYFQPVALESATIWKYRGQVLPVNKIITILASITEKQQDDNKALVVADVSLWVDGKRIYEAKNLSLAIASAALSVPNIIQQEYIVDPEEHGWLNDHCPTYLIPAMSMMSVVDCIAASAQKYFPDQVLISMENIQIFDWIIIKNPVKFLHEINIVNAQQAQITLKAGQKKLAKATINFAESYPVAPCNHDILTNTKNVSDPYNNLFHGEIFKFMHSLKINETGSSSLLNADYAHASFGFFNHLLFDALTHGIPHDNLQQWSAEISDEYVAYPALILNLKFYQKPHYSGNLHCETRFAGFHISKKFPVFKISLISSEKIIAELTLVEALFPKGRLGNMPASKRRAFLQDKKYIEDMVLSSYEKGVTRLAAKTVAESDWLPGSIAMLYAVEGDLMQMTQAIAVKEHFTRLLKIHPSEVLLCEDGVVASKRHNTQKFSYKLTLREDEVIIENA